MLYGRADAVVSDERLWVGIVGRDAGGGDGFGAFDAQLVFYVCPAKGPMLGGQVHTGQFRSPADRTARRIAADLARGFRSDPARVVDSLA